VWKGYLAGFGVEDLGCEVPSYRASSEHLQREASILLLQQQHWIL
jgi:hypothetical protein